MKGAGILLAFLFVASATAADLPRMNVLVDGQRVDVGTISMELTTYRVDFDRTLRSLTGGRATVRLVDSKTCRIEVNGEKRITLGVGEAASPVATIFSGERFRKVGLTEPALLRTVGKQKRLYIDVRALCEITGACADLDGHVMSFLTPEYWAGQLNIDKAKRDGLNVRSVGLCNDFGITPPARNMVLWVRPAQKSYVQIYKGLAGGLASPMLGYRKDRPVLLEGSDVPGMWLASHDEPVHAATEHLDLPQRGQAMYAAIVSKTDLGGVEAVDAINEGETSDWTVVGMRQEIADTSLDFRFEALRTGEDIAKFANRVEMPSELVLNLNGYGEGSQVKAGTRLLVIDKIEATQGDTQVTGLYEVRVGDSIEALAKRWGSPKTRCAE